MQIEKNEKILKRVYKHTYALVSTCFYTSLICGVAYLLDLLIDLIKRESTFGVVLLAIMVIIGYIRCYFTVAEQQSEELIKEIEKNAK